MFLSMLDMLPSNSVCDHHIFSIEICNCFIESHCYYTLDGQSGPDLWDSIAGLYPTKDKSFVRIHTNFPQ